MTLAPVENRRVEGSMAINYPLNKVCAHPECDQPVADPHHCFRRSQIGNSFWFVRIDGADPIPHVTGLCRDHHNDVTEHRSWIRLEKGVFNWYERTVEPRGVDDEGWELVPEAWVLVGPLNPQPGSVEGKPKRKRFKGEAKRKRKTISIRVPEGYEAETYDEKLEQATEITRKWMEAEYDPYPFIVLDAALQTYIEENAAMLDKK